MSGERKSRWFEVRRRWHAKAKRRGRRHLFERLEDRLALAVDSSFSAFDLLGNVSLIRDAQGGQTQFAHDALGRVTSVQGPNQQEFVRLAYDPNGNITRMHDATGYTFYAYDAFDRLTAVTKSVDDILGNDDDRQVGYSYDASGNLTTLTYPDGALVEYSYDAVNRLTQVAQGSDVTTYTYFSDGRLATLTLPNAITATYGYDAAGRLQDLVYRNSSNHLVTSFHYTFDANGNRTSMEVRRPNLETPDPYDFVSGLYQYAYDARDQLIEARYPDGVVVTYAYDGAGNRTAMITDPDGAGPQPPEVLNYHYGVENRLTHTTDAAGAVVTQYEYDARGNRIAETTGGETTIYEYDYRNLLVQVTKGATVVQYEYDGRGDRVARIENGVRTEYVNDVNRRYTQVLVQADSDGAAEGRYIYGLARLSGLLQGHSSPLYYLIDAIGSTSDLTDEAGMARTSYSYDAFGAAQPASPGTDTNQWANSFLFAGENVDEATNLIYLRARYYDPAVGRFLTSDPIGFGDGPNTYTYAASNPVNYIDPRGTLAWMPVITSVVTGITKSIADVRSSSDEKLYQGITGFVSGAAGGVAFYGGAIACGLGCGAYAAAETALRVERGLDYLFGRDTTFYPGVGETLVETGKNYVGAKLAKSVYRDNEFGELIVGTAFDVTANVVLQNGGAVKSSQNPANIPRSGAGTLLGGLHGGTTTAPPYTAPLSPATDRGGVLLDFPAQFIGNLSDITGATLDSATGQVVLLGEQVAGVPGLVLDDFVSAVRSVYASIEAPGVSINQPASGNPTDPQTVEYFAGVENTHLGYVCFEADRVLKSLAAGKDNITGQSVSSAVPGYKSMARRWADSYDPGNPAQTHDVRWWFKISDMKLVRSADAKSFEFDNVGIQLVAEDAETGQPATDPDALAFAQWFTSNFDAIAAEAYPYPTLATMDRPLLRLKQAAKSVAFAQFLRDNSVPVDFSWIDTYQLAFVDTPASTPTAIVETPVGGNISVFYGGINLGALPQYLADAAGQVNATALDASQSRPSDLVQTWLLSNQMTDALAVSVAAEARDGNVVLADTDLSWATVGEYPLTVTRFYNSFRPVDGPLGHGWEVVPTELQFERPAYLNSGDALNGLREGTVRYVDRLTGQSLTFQSSLEVIRHGDGAADYTGLIAGLPAFVPGDLRDGSSLEMSADKNGYILTRPNGGRQTFDTEGRLLTQADRHGNALTYVYSGERLVGIGNVTGMVFTFTYVDGRIVRADGRAGERVDYTYDPDGNLVSATRARGQRRYTYQYDAQNRMTGSIGPDGRIRFGAELDIRNRATSRSDLRGNAAEYQYALDPATQRRITTAQDVVSGLTSQTMLDLQNRPVSVTDVLGRAQFYTYDSNSALPHPTRVQLPDPSRPGIQFSYDSNGNLLTILDPANDPLGNGVTQSFTYDDNQNLTRHVDPRGIATNFVYDLGNNLIEVERAGSRWTYQYTLAGQLAATTDPLNHTTRFFYDAAGNLMRVRDALNAETVYAYDALNRLQCVTDPSGLTVTFFYNDLDQVIRMVAPQGEWHRTYDPTTHWLTATTDFAGNTTTFAYDAATGDLVSETIAGAMTTFAYDRFGNLTSLRDAEGTQTKFVYDELNRPVGTYTAFDEVVATLRDAYQPWTVVGGTLVVAGSDAVDRGDIILVENDGAGLWLIVNEQSFSLAGEVFNAIYVDAGNGDDLVDLRATPASISATILGGGGSNILLGGAGADLILGGDGADWLEGGPGNDWLMGGAGSDVLFGHSSAREKLFTHASDRNVLFGEAGNDLLFSRALDHIQGGAGANNLYGVQEDGAFKPWTARDIPLGLSGRLLLLGGNESNRISLKILDGEYLLVTINERTQVIHREAFDFVNGLFSEIVVLSAGGNDVLDFRDSPVPVLIVAGAGNDQVLGSNASNRIFGGPGNDYLQGGTGDDIILSGSGANVVDGGEGSDRLWGSSDPSTSVFRAMGGRNYIMLGPGDQAPAATGHDLVVPAGQQAPRRIPAQVAPQVVQHSNTVAVSQPARVSSPTRPPQITHFSVRPPIVEFGEIFDVVVRADAVQWVRLEVAVDINGNGRFDQGTDRILVNDRGQNVGAVAAYIHSRRLDPGTYTLFARLTSHDGNVTPWATQTVTILPAPPPPELPANITVPPSHVTPIIPLRNGDATIRGNELRTVDQVDIFEVSWGIVSGGGAWIWTTGNADTIVAVYDESGARIAMDDDGGPGANGEVRLPYVAANRTYYVAVGAARDALGPYTLEMDGPYQTFADIYTPPANYVGSASGSVTRSNRVAYYQVIAPSNATLLDFSVNVSPGLGVWVRLEDSAHRVIGAADTSRPDQNQFCRNIPVVGSQAYYLTVYGLYGTSGDYTVNVDFYPDELDFPEDLLNPQLGEFQSLIVHANGTYALPNQSITSPGQLRTYLLSAPSSGTYEIVTRGATDMQLALYDGLGSQRLTWDDNSGSGGNARLTVDLTRGNSYWIVARAKGLLTGVYSIEGIGPSPTALTVPVTGLRHRGRLQATSLNNVHTDHFQLIAPLNATSLDVTVTPIASYHTVDVWLRIEDEAGRLSAPVNVGGVGTVERIVGYPVIGGRKYWVIVYGWGATTGPFQLDVNFDPGFEGSVEIPISTTTHWPQPWPAIAMNAAGNAVYVWAAELDAYESRDLVFFQRFDADDRAVGPETTVNPPNADVYQTNPAVGIDPAGNFVISWSEAGRVYARRFNAQGNPQGSAFDIGFPAAPEYEYKHDVAVASSGAFMIVGAYLSSLYGRLYNAIGQPITGLLNLDSTLDDKLDVAVTADGTGRYIASWRAVSNGSHIYALRLDGAGHFLSNGRFRVAPDQTFGQYGAAVSANVNGAFIVAWGGWPNRNTYAQRFDADGREMGPWLQLNERTPSDSGKPDVILKDNGEFVATWASSGLDGSGFNVYARQYDAAGNPASLEEFRVNTTTAGDQWCPAIAGNGADRFGFVWQSNPSIHARDIVGQFLNLPTPIPSPILGLITPDTEGSLRIEFDRVPADSGTASRSLRISNHGTAILTGSVSLVGHDATRFSLGGNPSFVLPPSASYEYLIGIQTDRRGTFSAKVMVHTSAEVLPTVVPVSGAVVPTPDRFDGNNTRETATPLGTIANVTLTDLSLHDEHDQDWFTFTVERRASVQIAASYLYAEGDLDIVLRDAAGRVVAASSTVTDDEYISIELEPEQTWYLQVYSTGVAANVYDLQILVELLVECPLIESLSVYPAIVLRTATLTLTAEGVSDPDGQVVRVEFYRGDTLLGVDDDGTDGWSLTIPTADWSLGEHMLFARAVEDGGAYSEPANVTVVVGREHPSVELGTLPLFTRRVRNMELHNDGSEVLTVRDTVTKSLFEISPSGLSGWSIAPGTSKMFNVSFTAGQIGYEETVLVMVGDDDTRLVHLSITVISGWHNFRYPEDVDGDGMVTSLDALIVINDINQNGSRALLPRTAEKPGTPFFLDTTNNGRVVPIDVLLVINSINQQLGSEAQGEPEARSASPDKVLAVTPLLLFVSLPMPPQIALPTTNAIQPVAPAPPAAPTTASEPLPVRPDAGEVDQWLADEPLFDVRAALDPFEFDELLADVLVI
jgi:RHS repeat-associated protein